MEQLIVNIAALVFWTNVRKKTYNLIRNYVLNRQFNELWVAEIVPVYLEWANFEIRSSNNEVAYKKIYHTVNEYIYNATLKEQNILGTIYLDDTIECRTLNFDEFYLLESLQQVYAEYRPIQIPNFNIIGTLMLRTPLPSIVFTKSKEIPSIFIVNDTTKALGFQVNLIFSVDEIFDFPDNPYGIKNCLSGIFEIHNYNNSDNLWHKIIPNSLCYNKLRIGDFCETIEVKPKGQFKSPKYVTNANIKRALFKIDKKNFNYESEIYKHSINYLNLLEKRDLLLVKCLYEFPEIFFEDYYSKIISDDKFDFVFEKQQPAFHSCNCCSNLLRDFENFLIPEQIKENKQENEYRDWFKKNYKLLEKDDLLKEYHYKKWGCLPLKVDYENSGAYEFKNLNLDEIEQIIDDHLLKIKKYIDQSEMIKTIITVLGKRSYAYNKLDSLDLNNLPYNRATISSVLKTFEIDYKQPLIALLKEYYRIKYNPNLVFEENILLGLGFRQCKSCNNVTL